MIVLCELLSNRNLLTTVHFVLWHRFAFYVYTQCTRLHSRPKCCCSFASDYSFPSKFEYDENILSAHVSSDFNPPAWGRKGRKREHTRTNWKKSFDKPPLPFFSPLYSGWCPIHAAEKQIKMAFHSCRFCATIKKRVSGGQRRSRIPSLPSTTVLFLPWWRCCWTLFHIGKPRSVNEKQWTGSHVFSCSQKHEWTAWPVIILTEHGGTIAWGLGNFFL